MATQLGLNDDEQQGLRHPTGQPPCAAPRGLGAARINPAPAALTLGQSPFPSDSPAAEDGGPLTHTMRCGQSHQGPRSAGAISSLLFVTENSPAFELHFRDAHPSDRQLVRWSSLRLPGLGRPGWAPRAPWSHRDWGSSPSAHSPPWRCVTATCDPHSCPGQRRQLTKSHPGGARFKLFCITPPLSRESQRVFPSVS